MFAIGFLNYLDRNVLTGAANIVAHELGLGIDSIGYIASAFIIVYTTFTIPMGIWADRAKRKNVVAFCVAVWSVATALTALSFNFLSLFLSRMVLGIGEAGYFPAGTALLSDYFSRKKRSRIMSWWSAGQLVGVLFGFVIGGVVADLYVGSWRLAFIFTGIPGLCSWPFCRGDCVSHATTKPMKRNRLRILQRMNLTPTRLMYQKQFPILPLLLQSMHFCN